MNYENFYYKYLDIHFEEAEIRELIKQFPLIDSRFEKVDVNIIKGLMPTLFFWFDKKNLVVEEVFIINHKPDFKQDIHVDYTGDIEHKLAINIPLNPLAWDSTTRMYDLVDEEEKFKLNKRNPTDKVIYCKFEKDQVVKITEYKSLKPVVINISKPHSAWNNTNHIRGVITFRFKEDPVELIKDSI